MADQVVEALALVVKFVEIFGAMIMVAGFVLATVRWVRRSLLNAQFNAEVNYRRALGRVILIGLELLVAATIIKTIAVKFEVEDMGLLAIMVAIRTSLGWATFLEINGCWPWQSQRSD